MEERIHPNRLAKTALALHTALSEKKIKHRFLGGYEIMLLGFNRHTKDVDVEIELPFLFKATGLIELLKSYDFIILEPDSHKPLRGLRGLYSGSENGETYHVGIDILVSGKDMAYLDMPKGHIELLVEDKMLPFFPKTHLFLSKVLSCARRPKERDVQDVVLLYRQIKGELDLEKMKHSKKITAADREEIEKRWSRERHPAFFAVIDELFETLAL